ncbi:uncharacterized protein LOC124123068 [Haliotis rufescens]|uniref:uncharacterized protein LOC124123068 n=1 Tax=Haliotis rufescens TaxID=6454 RepID=UPI001EB003E3|nr:uncharacterized protein LOC124123068 [Haliotis rufescens]
MIKKHLKANPPSHYEVGEIVLVRHLGKDKGVCRGGQKITSSKAVEGEIVEVNEKLHKYKVRIGKKLSWRSVSQITSITRQQEEQKRRHSRHADDYMNVMARLQKEMMMPTVLSSDSLLQKLEDMAGRRGCIVKHNSGGGNCMFLSLSDQIYHVLNIEMNALEVRENIVEHLKAHPNTIDGTPLEDFVSTQQSWEAYLSAMEAPGTWGDHLVVLGAVEFLQVDIEVLTSASETHPILLKTVKRQETTKKLFLGHISEFHYVSLHKLGQLCSDCHLEMHMCQCVDNINATDIGSSPHGFNSEEDMETSSDPLPDTRQVSRAFFEKEEQNLAMYLQNLMQRNFSGDRDGRGQRHTMFLESYLYQDVKAGFASQFIPAELYGHIIEWIRSTFTRRIHKDKSHPYTSSLTSVLTVRNVDENLRKLSLQYMCATTHYILYVAVKEACPFLIQKCLDMEYQHLDKECSEMELHPKRL